MTNLGVSDVHELTYLFSTSDFDKDGYLSYVDICKRKFGDHDWICDPGVYQQTADGQAAWDIFRGSDHVIEEHEFIANGQSVYQGLSPAEIVDLFGYHD